MTQNLEQRIRDLERKQKGKQALSAVLWGLLVAWAWSTLKPRLMPLWNRTPRRWKIIGGLLLAALLAFVARMPELAWPVLVATLALTAQTVLRSRQAAPVGAEAQQEWWAKLVDESPILQPVFRGSQLQVKVPHELWYIELAGGRTPAQAKALKPNLESLFRTPPGALRVEGDPTASWRVVVASGDMPWERPAIEGTARVVQAPKEESPSRAHNARPRASARVRARGWVAGLLLGSPREREKARLKQQAAEARRRGERAHKGGRRRRRSSVR